MWHFAQVLAYEGEIFLDRATDPGEPGQWLAILGILAVFVLIGAMYAVGVWLCNRGQRRNGSDNFPRSSGRIDPHQL